MNRNVPLDVGSSGGKKKKKITKKVAGYSVLENHRVQPAFLPQVLLRASEAAGREDTSPAPAETSAPHCPCSRDQTLSSQCFWGITDFVTLAESKHIKYCVNQVNLKLIYLAKDKLDVPELFLSWGPLLLFLCPGSQLPLVFQIQSLKVT